MWLQAGVRCLRLLLGACAFRRHSARCWWERRERVSAAGRRHEGLQPIAVEPKQGLDQAKLLFGLLAPAFTPRTAQGMPREELPWGPRCGARAGAGGAGLPQQMFWDSSACSRFGREHSAWRPFQCNLRLISNFWLHYLAGLFIFCLSEFSSLPVVVPSS